MTILVSDSCIQIDITAVLCVDNLATAEIITGT